MSLSKLGEFCRKCRRSWNLSPSSQSSSNKVVRFLNVGNSTGSSSGSNCKYKLDLINACQFSHTEHVESKLKEKQYAAPYISRLVNRQSLLDHMPSEQIKRKHGIITKFTFMPFIINKMSQLVLQRLHKSIIHQG
jgi:hypothetical protein